ncbi:MAG: PqqD family protein [Clostridiales bacterium]|nr:PqqD family protein [Clostridiales bacterium]
MKIKDGYKLCKVKDSSIVIAVDNAVMDFNGLVTLNSTGEFIWSMLEKGEMTDEQVIEAIAKEYNVDKNTASADFYEFADSLKEAGFLE